MTTFGPPQTDQNHWPPRGDEPPPPPHARLGWSLPVVIIAAIPNLIVLRLVDNSSLAAQVVVASLTLLVVVPMVIADIGGWAAGRRARYEHRHWRIGPYEPNELGNLATRCPCGAVIIRTDHPGGSHYLTIDADGNTRHRYLTVRQKPVP